MRRRAATSALLAITIGSMVSLQPTSALARPQFATEIADSSYGVVGWNTSLELDAQEQPAVSYYDFTRGILKFAQKAGGTWMTEIADSSPTVDVGWYGSLALDDGGNPHISYHADYDDIAFHELRYASKVSGVWRVEAVERSVNELGVWYTSIALDPQSNPHVSYYDYNDTRGRLRFASRTSGSWQSETVDASTAFVGSFPSLVIDPYGTAHVTYSDDETLQLKYAVKTSGTWSIEVADGAGRGVGAYNSLALDAQGNPCVSYPDLIQGALRYAHRVGGTWIYERVDAAPGIVCLWTSLALDRRGEPHISYFDYSARNLRYARKRDGQWAIQVVDEGVLAGFENSIAIDRNGVVHVSYYNTPTSDLKYARSTLGLTREEFGQLRLTVAGTDAALRVFPNPSRGQSLITYSVSRSATTDMAVYDASGRLVRQLVVPGERSTPLGSLTWDHLDSSGHPVAPGTYFLRLTSSRGDQVTERVTIVR